MRIIVTGSSGSIGSAAVQALRRAGHEVVPVDMREGEEGTRVADLCDRAALGRIFEGAEAVCHFGNLPGFGPNQQAEGFSKNVTATYNVFEAAASAGAKIIVNASSVQAYGVVGEAISVPAYLPVDEEHPLWPKDAYQMTKFMSEAIADAFVRRDGSLSVYSLRFTAVRNPSRPRKVPVPPGARSAITGSLFTFVHVDDAATAVRLCCENVRPGHTALNITSPRSMEKWTKQMLEEAYGSLPPFRRELGPADALVSGEKARQVLGFVADLPDPLAGF